MNFYSTEILANLRNRSYFEVIDGPGSALTPPKQFIKSEGAWRITIFNSGTVNVFLDDGSGELLTLVPTFGFPVQYILDGHPAVTRDDEIEVTFFAADLGQQVTVIYDRMVLKKETNEYAVDTVMSQIKGKG